MLRRCPILKFNTFRPDRYLRAKFVEGRFFLASEATDLELQVIEHLRTIIEKTVGNIAVSDAWKVSRLSNTELLIAPGQAWFQGLPFEFRFNSDQRVTGTNLNFGGNIPAGLSKTDQSDGSGKKITFSGSTPTNNYKIVIAAEEQVITDIQDPFIKNSNITESTGQKVRLLYRINIVREEVQTEKPVPYTSDNTGNQNANLVNKIIITPTASNNGSLVALNPISSSTQIDGRNLELIVKNDPSGLCEIRGQVQSFSTATIVVQSGAEFNVDGGSIDVNGDIFTYTSYNKSTGTFSGVSPDPTALILVGENVRPIGRPFPAASSDQAIFANGKLIDSIGNTYYVNTIFNDTISTQLVIRIDKEPDQLDPSILNGFPYTLIKREVYAQDDISGNPIGKLYWPIANATWSSTNGFVHNSSISDLRERIIDEDNFQKVLTTKVNLTLTEGGILGVDTDGITLNWSSDFKLINPSGPTQLISSNGAVLLDGGTLSYTLDILNGGIISLGNFAATSTNIGTTLSLSGSPDLSSIRLGNVFRLDNTKTFAPADVNTGTDTMTVTSHGYSNDAPITFSTTGTLPTGLSAFTTYYVVSATTNTFQVAATPAGLAINLITQGTGTHTVNSTQASYITAIDDVNNIITVNNAFTIFGSGTIYRDSFGPGTVDLDETVFVLAVRSGNRITVGGILELTAGETNSIYDERLQFPTGLSAITNITLPVNTRNASKPQYYSPSRGNLEVYLNQLLKFQGVDWLAIDSNTIQFVFALPNDSEVHFRIDSLPSGSVGGGGTGGSDTLQQAYNAGNTISITPGLPVTITGTGKLADFQGDISVDGVIDPKGLELTPQASNPLNPTANGIWVNTSEQLIYEGNTTSNISQRLDDLESGTTIPITAGTGLTRTGNSIDFNTADTSLTVNANDVQIKRDPLGAIGLTVSGISLNTDNSTVELDSNNLRVKDLGITTAKIAAAAVTEDKLATSVAGNGLVGGAGSPLSVNLESTNPSLQIVTDQLGVKLGHGITKDSIGTTINIDGSSLSKSVSGLRVASSGVTETELNISVAGNGLSGGGGTPLSVNTDNSTIEIDSDTLRVKDLGITLAKMASNSVNENKLTTSVAGGGLTGGGGSPLAVGAGYGIQTNADNIDVLFSPAMRINAIAGESFLANTTYLVRWGISGETADRVYKATAADASDNKYQAVGLLLTTSSVIAGNTVSVVTEGSYTLGSLDTLFVGGDIGKTVYLTNNGSGGFTLVPSTTVGDAQYIVGVVEDTNKIWVDLKGLSSIVPEPLYDAEIYYPTGLAATTNIILPSGKTYNPTAFDLEVYVNQLFKHQGTDWTSVDNTTIQFPYALPNDSRVVFRINALSSGVLTGSGGGGGTLQDAYDTGSSITTVTGVPVTINGPASQKLLVINGDITVTGVIDPKGLELSSQTSNPLSVGQKGIWVDNSGNLMHETGASSNNISQTITNITNGSAVQLTKKQYLNSTGSSIPIYTPVYTPSPGTIGIADSTDSGKFRVIGITTETILNGQSGYVALSGIVTGLMGFAHNSYIFVGLTAGSLVDVGPTLGPYPSGFQVIRLGVMEGTNLLLQIQHSGTL